MAWRPPADANARADANHVQAVADHARSEADIKMSIKARANLVVALPPTPRSRVAYGLAGVGLLGIGLVAGLFVKSNAAPLPTPPHVAVIMLENKGYAATLGSCGADPYLCGLASTYASVTGWTGVTHPSEPNYVAFESGSVGACTGDTSCPAFSVTRQDLGGQLSAAGIPWVSWQESMPSACFTGQTSGNYALKHSFGGFFADDKTPCRIDPYPGSASAVGTLTGASAPDFVWITPNLVHDMHSGSVAAGDAWLKANVAPLLASSWFTNFDSTVVITMDEGDPGCCNAVPMVVISNNAKGTGNVSKPGNHYGTLRTIEEAFGLSLLGSASGGTDLSSLFGSTVTPPTPTPSGTPSPTGSPTASPTPTPTPSPTPTTGPFTVDCSGDITAALQSAVDAGGTVTISAGTCALSANIAVKNAVIIEGAGATNTFLVQHARQNVFQITAPGVTVEDVNLDTRTYNPGVPPVPKDPVPGVLFSNSSDTSVINVTGEAGTGFGMRVTGPNPCSTFQTTGTVISGVDMSTNGTGGFAAVDVDCTNGATLTNLTVSGGIVALFEDANVTLNGLDFTRGEANQQCEPAVFVTGPANHITATGIITNSAIDRVKPPTSAISIMGTKVSGDSC